MRHAIPLLVLLAACQFEDEAIDDPCRAREYGALVGTNIAAVSLPAELNHRIVGPDTAVTMDFMPDRLNVLVDRQGRIFGLRCG
ncbi:I78 family peptidase inhibitor [Jannaschia ovalis]|uniref:I78 family peptidase inhibitor n=1 Tax=Jannaschia ovalis TaxID=3038773 RepID=A0ABY8L742_9RHOB|nr:I78 family peptidase inhibitor [Jannaschia sp. GRR-S6-38]WGH77202.1 I78 family peptidase inhibitor [Jannaschia sp. GRR-S6-38]